LKTIWDIFCIQELIVCKGMHIGTIDEIVENRNAISHGRKSPEEI
jgi:hypothetical protein